MSSTYIGVVGPESDVGLCRDSIQQIQRRPGDSAPGWVRATKGFEARQAHINNFIKSQHSHILLLDHDMVFPEDTLERLRSHNLPFVSGLYMRRQYQPIAPVWFRPWRGQWPYEPWTGPIKTGQLHKIGASGWGCMYMHRSVVMDTKAVLKGEAEVLEDDMDLWPYDLERIMNALHGLQEIAQPHTPIRTLRAALAQHVAVLEEEIKPLRGIKSNMGSDIRFPFYALKAGHQLWGDPDISCAHMIDYPLTVFDHAQFLAVDQNQKEMKKQTRKMVLDERKRVQDALGRLQ